MTVEVVFETHSVSVDNERGVATGWLPGTLSARGRALAVELGQRRRNDGLVAIFTSDLGRAVETVEVAFAGSGIPVFVDWRLRECDYGELNGAPKAAVHGERGGYRRTPYPGGESWEQATGRVERYSTTCRHDGPAAGSWWWDTSRPGWHSNSGPTEPTSASCSSETSPGSRGGTTDWTRPSRCGEVHQLSAPSRRCPRRWDTRHGLNHGGW